MDNDEIMARFGISSNLAYGLFIQSILVIFAAIIAIWGIFVLVNQGDYSLRFVTNIISLLVCISLLVYSFYGFNAKKHQEVFFNASIVLYIILIMFGLFTSAFDFKNPVSFLTLITLICAIFFLSEHKKNYQSANIAMLAVLISGIIVVIFDIFGGMPWFIALKYLIIPFSLGLTYFERTQRGKYDF